MPANSEERLALGQTLIEAYNQHDLQPWRERLSADYVADYPGAAGLDRCQALRYNQALLDAFPDIAVTVRRKAVQGDAVLVHWSATHRDGSLNGVSITQLRDRRIVREETFWNCTDPTQEITPPFPRRNP